MTNLIIEIAGEDIRAENARQFCKAFLNDNSRLRYLFGRNIYSKSIREQVTIDGFIDDFYKEDFYEGIPVIKSVEVPKNSLILVVSGGKPLTVMQQLKAFDLEALDYFAFFRWSGLSLTPVVFNEGFERDFSENNDQYQWIYARLSDPESRAVLSRLMSFRFKYDLTLLEGFTCREDVQYFEDFLNLQKTDEVFVDIGGFDGYTTREFIRHCPDYQSIHVFEPDPDNFAKCTGALVGLANVHLYPLGLSDQKQSLKLSVNGSGSQISNSGTLEIQVDRLDDVLDVAPTWIKMDVEGAELVVLSGAVETIRRHHPRLAIAIYHYLPGKGPFWQIPRAVLAIRDDYDIFVRHYTESIYETVMFFIPRK